SPPAASARALAPAPSTARRGPRRRGARTLSSASLTLLRPQLAPSFLRRVLAREQYLGHRPVGGMVRHMRLPPALAALGRPFLERLDGSEAGRQLGRGGGTTGAILFQAVHDDLLERGRNRQLGARLRVRRGCARMIEHDLHGVLTLEYQLAGDQPIGDATD